MTLEKKVLDYFEITEEELTKMLDVDNKFCPKGIDKLNYFTERRKVIKGVFVRVQNKIKEANDKLEKTTGLCVKETGTTRKKASIALEKLVLMTLKGEGNPEEGIQQAYNLILDILKKEAEYIAKEAIIQFAINNKKENE